MRIIIVIYFQIGYFSNVLSYDQLIKHGSTVATSSSVGWGGSPTKTVDGNYAQNDYTYCMHTKAGQKEAWLRIDLGDFYNLKSVKIWYRNDSKTMDNTRRLKGFSIRLSNLREPVPSEICYQDPGKKKLPVILEKNCTGVARYLWFYTNKDNGDGVFLEICEVQAYGCPAKRYGENCSPCSGCNGTCDIVTGQHCSCLKPGYQPPQCVEECSKGLYGKNCSLACGHCAKNASCNHVNGSCPSGYCEPGWKHTNEKRCNQECDEGTYGFYCRQNCSGHCAGGLSCNKANGVCPGGCSDGWRNPQCNKTCWKGLYGKNCNRLCGHCAENATCDHVNGNCPSGLCESGWKHREEKKCNQECDNHTFGYYCKENCSGHCLGGLPCNKADGICRSGCADGWKNSQCNETCRKSLYGKNCSLSCGHCAKPATCDHETGSCPGNCEPGWKRTYDKRCNKKCDDYTFGLHCTSKCSVHCAGEMPCNKADGICHGGCEDGWMNQHCNEKCQGGFYGRNCSVPCGNCYGNKSCNHVSGSCPSRYCNPGWKRTNDRRCNQECDNGTFGDNCRYPCSGNCAEGLMCSKANGVCPKGCTDGWISARCSRKCEKGLYGKNCSRRCGHCNANATCDHVNGSCPDGDCELGWKDTKEKRCDKECDDGTFGNHCKKNCSGNCAGGLPCNKADGICLTGCADGWINPQCNEKCKANFYGRNCSLPCGNCAKNTPCDHVTGSCPSGICEPGWKRTLGQRCDQECDNGTFGYHCMYNCSGHCAGGLTCNKADGICPGGCADGWANNKCNETCGVGFYGKGCQEHCGHCGGPETCHHINGSCPGLCEPGYQGEKCVIECENGTFGLRCNFTCAEGCVSVCNKKNGTCDLCQYGYIGEFCNITVAEAQEQEVAVAAVGVGFGFMVIVLIAIIVLVVVLARKAKHRKAAGIELPERNGVPNNELLENKPQDKANKTVEDGHVEENPEVEDTVIDNGEMKTLIKIADLGKKIKLFSMEENKKFTAEFKGIPYGEQPHIPCSVAKQQENMPKNRYKTTFPYDHSRVVLNICPENDYINANYIKDMEGKRCYIATQGPRKNTVQDFWAMIWQENIRVIVMVTNLTEGSTIKCEQYWPGQGAQMTSGPYCLKLMSQKDYANYTQRDINITDKKTKVVRTVNQVQFTAWPDHGTPSPVELLVFYRHVMSLRQMYPDSLMVVHCSAGIGRTGTFIALDALYKQGLKEGKIDVVEYVKIMREDRMNMIQNAGQYVFLYKALYEIFKMNGRLLKKEQFIQEVTSQLMSDKAANASYFKKEFNELLAIRPVLDEQDTKDARQKIDLNMTKTVLPADNVRSFLTSYVRGRGNYYNAVSMSSYTLRDGLIAAQYPVQGAAIDLVRLLIDHECTILVSINQLTDIASSAEWFTTSAEKSVVSPYKTMLGANRSVSPNLKMTVLKLKHDKDSEWQTVKVLEILNWRVNEKLPAEEEVLVELMNKIQEIVKDPETKITVLSRDGATGCGIFCAVYNAIQQLQQDNEVDMFTIVRQLQMRRPEMISSMNEYQCCCQVVANFFDAHKDDIYANAQGQPEVTKAEENVYANT